MGNAVLNGRALVKFILLLWSSVLLMACQEGGAPVDPIALVSDTPVLKVYKSPTCGCCADWVNHVEDSGFKINLNDTNNIEAVKQTLGIKPELQSCHTAVTAKSEYFFEGHVPAKYIHQFLENPPAGARGLAVPGMPVGSPGMEVDDKFQPYQVLLVREDGSTEVYANIERPEAQYE